MTLRQILAAQERPARPDAIAYEVIWHGAMQTPGSSTKGELLPRALRTERMGEAYTCGSIACIGARIRSVRSAASG